MAAYARVDVVDESSLVQPAALPILQPPEADESTSLLAEQSIKQSIIINTAELLEARDDKRSQNVSFLIHINTDVPRNSFSVRIIS